MGNPFSKSVDPEEEKRKALEEQKKEDERIRKMREEMFSKSNPVNNYHKSQSKSISQIKPKITENKEVIPTSQKEEKPQKTNNEMIVNTSKSEEITKKEEKTETKESTDFKTTSLDMLKRSVSNSEYIKNTSQNQEQAIQKKPINKENTAIEKIFKITLNPDSDKFIYLHEYHAKLMSINPNDDAQHIFKIDDLDVILLEHVFHNETINEDLLGYLLEVYHRAIELIEVRFKKEFDESFLQIRKVIANYICLFVHSTVFPQSVFEFHLDPNLIYSKLKEYFKQAELEEVVKLMLDLVNSEEEVNKLSIVFNYFFNLIHEENTGKMHNQPVNFFSCEKLKKNLDLLINLFSESPKIMKLYCMNQNFIPKFPNLNGKFFQMTSFLSPFFCICSFEADKNTLKMHFFNENEVVIRNNISKLNNFISELTILINLIMKNKDTCEYLYSWFYAVIDLNFERTKMYANSFITSSFGFLMNVISVLLKIFYEDKNLKNNDEVFEIVKEIDLVHCITSHPINFSKYERINNEDSIRDYLNSFSVDLLNKEKYNNKTKLYFIINILQFYIVKNFDEEYSKIINQISEMIQQGKRDDPLFKEQFAYYVACEVYLRNQDFIRPLLKLCEISSIIIMMLNNKKYTIDSLQKNKEQDYFDFLDNFNAHFDKSQNNILSSLPLFCVKNIFNTSIMIRKHFGEFLVSEMNSTRILVYFSIIYSSQIEIMQNPHLRSEILDILIYFFIIDQNERNQKQISSILKLLDDDFVIKNLIYSIMKVFTDAERLGNIKMFKIEGTSNQFYEKFTIRHKILYLIENMMKSHKYTYQKKLIDFNNDNKEESTKLVNVLINDLTYLNDECIQKLTEIKKYQELINDVEKFNALDEETKKLEQERFYDNDRRVKNELKLFNSSMEFMVNICRNCQSNFMNYKLAENLANLLNYSLDIFASPRGLKLKIKNMSEYNFNPKFILGSLVSIYASFVDYREFLEYIVMDERSFKISNFEKVVEIKESGRSNFDEEDYEKFTLTIQKLKDIQKEILSTQISYDDASEEFYDPITSCIMDDPVMLPHSKQIVDRNTIEKHLLSNSIDPFDRSKLSKDMLIPCLELKLKIEEYKNKKKKDHIDKINK